MAAILQLRRGTTAAKPTLFAGEMYVNTTSQSLQVSIDGSTEITLAKLNSVNSGSFNVSGDITLGGTITIGDNTSDNIVINADLSSSIIPNNDNSFDLGSTTFRYRTVNATSISGAIASTNGVISGSSQLTLLNAFTASANGHITDINTKTGSFETKFISIGASTSSLNSFTSSAAPRLTNLETTSASVNISISNLNTYSASVSNSIQQLSIYSSSVSNSIQQLNTFTASNANTSLNATTASFAPRITNLETTSASVNISVSNLNTYSASVSNSIGNINAFTSSQTTIESGQNSKLTNLETTSASVNISVTNLNSYSASVSNSIGAINAFSSSENTKSSTLATYTGSVDIKFTTLATYTSSLNVWTSSVATTGSNTFIGNEVITGSLTVTGSVKGNIVPITIASLTASLDMNLGSYFTLTLANTVTTHIRATNIAPGMSATLLITTGTNSTASLSPLLLQPSGSAYSASIGVSKKDVLSLVSFDSTNMYVVSTKAMQ